METITLTQEEYKQKIYESYKEGFQAAIEALKHSFTAIDEIRPTPLAYECPKCGTTLEKGGWCEQHGLPAQPAAKPIR